jgi:hypothetical protein
MNINLKLFESVGDLVDFFIVITSCMFNATCILSYK